jgi:hypothetical protein
MADDGVFIDIFSRLNLASVDRVLADVKAAMKRGGTEAGRDFSAGFDTSFKQITAASDAAFRSMQTGMAELQRAEARINDLRARNYSATTQAMIAAQRELDAAIGHTNDLIAASSKAQAAERDAVAVPGGRSRGRGRSPVIPIPRGADRAGAGAAIGLVGAGAYGIDVAGHVNSNINQIRSSQMGMPNRESSSELAQMTQWAYQNAGKLGPKSSAQNLSRALQQSEGMGYRGQAAINIVSTSMQESTVTGANFSDTLSALDTQLRDVGETTDRTTASLSQMQQASSQNVRAIANAKLPPDRMNEFFDSMHSYEPSLRALSPGADPGNLLAQGQAMMLTLMQTGMSPQQAGQNLQHLMQQFNMQPGGKAWNTILQIGGNPQAISDTLNTQGPAAALQMIQQTMQSHEFVNSRGQTMIHTGIQMNNSQLLDTGNTMYANMNPQAQAYVNSHPEVAGGMASKMSLRKAVESGQLTADESQGVEQYSRVEGSARGYNKYLQKGGNSDMAPAQFSQMLFGSADMNRTFTILSQSAQELSDRLNSILQGGEQNILESSFKNAMSGDTIKQWHALGDAAGGLAGRMTNDLLPTLSEIVNGSKSVVDFLNKHQAVGQALLTAMEDVAGAWAIAKTINFFGGIKQAFDKVSTGATTLAGAETTAAGEVKLAGTEIAAAGAEASEAGLAGALKGAAANVAGAFAPAVLAAIIGEQISGPIDNWINNSGSFGNWLEHHTPADLGKESRDYVNRQLAGPPSPAQQAQNQKQGVAATNPRPVPPGAQVEHPSNLSGLLGGYYSGGSVKTANPYSQPLMNVRDTGGDSVLGMLPDGSAVGLRGHEGILTPEATAALGGEDAINSINANPWNNPFKVATTFYGSFSKGVAKYSPWGKYLEASSQSLDSLEQEFDKTTDIHRGGKGKGSVYQKAMQHYQQTGQWPQSDSGAPKGKAGVVAAVKQAYIQSGFPPNQWSDVEHIITHESGWNPGAKNPSSGAFGLGQFLGHENDKYGAMGAYSSDPSQQAGAMMAYIRDRYGDPAHAWSHWKANSSYATGGVVGYSPGGVVQPPGPDLSPIAPTDTGGTVPGAKPPVSPPVKPPVSQAPRQPSPPKTPPKPPEHPHAAAKPSPRLSPQGDKAGTAPRATGDRNIKKNPSRAGGQENTSKGFSVGGGLIGGAEGAAAAAGGPFGAAAQPAMQLINRAIGYGGQLVGIGMEGLLETFTLNDSKLGDPTNSLFGKVALGIAGAHPSPKNSAGVAAQQFNPKQDLDQGAMAGKQTIPQVHMENTTIHNHGNDMDYDGMQRNIASALHGMGGLQSQGQS